VPEVAPLARYYATVGGELPYGTEAFNRDLRQAILARRETLGPFIQHATVQTNETGRGVAWLLPLVYSGWEAVQLVDLGASAGLNLVAEKRAYRLADEKDGLVIRDIGQGQPVQFMTKCQGEANHLLTVIGDSPRITGRVGCDVAPFLLEDREDERTLSAFIWGDQPQRLQRLQEGIAAYRLVNQAEVPVRLFRVDLPDDLPQFLRQHVPTESGVPVVIYNTYMTIYLKDRGTDLQEHIQAWAFEQQCPILWLQWEPAWVGPEPPVFGWCQWTADLWSENNHHKWRLGWVHPHGTHAQWEPGFSEWVKFCKTMKVK